MRLEKREHPEAREELRGAAFWYDDREPGLGDDFYDAIDEAIARISDWSRSAPVFPGWVDAPTVHAMAVALFPYRVLYYLTDTSFVVLAYAHSSRKPRYWSTDSTAEAVLAGGVDSAPPQRAIYDRSGAVWAKSTRNFSHGITTRDEVNVEIATLHLSPLIEPGKPGEWMCWRAGEETFQHLT